MKRVLGLFIAAFCLLAVPSLSLAGDEGKQTDGKADKAKDKGKGGDKKQGDKKADSKEEKKDKGW